MQTKRYLKWRPGGQTIGKKKNKQIKQNRTILINILDLKTPILRFFSSDSNKPLMLLIHKTWCGACKGNLDNILRYIKLNLPYVASFSKQSKRENVGTFNKMISPTINITFAALKPAFAESQEIADFSKNFVMVNLEVRQ